MLRGLAASCALRSSSSIAFYLCRTDSCRRAPTRLLPGVHARRSSSTNGGPTTIDRRSYGRLIVLAAFRCDCALWGRPENGALHHGAASLQYRRKAEASATQSLLHRRQTRLV